MTYKTFMQSVSPIIANELAMIQMQNSVDSSFGIQAYTFLSNYDWMLFMLLVVLVFYKDILNVINNIKEKKK